MNLAVRYIAVLCALVFVLTTIYVQICAWHSVCIDIENAKMATDFKSYIKLPDKKQKRSFVNITEDKMQESLHTGHQFIRRFMVLKKRCYLSCWYNTPFPTYFYYGFYLQGFQNFFGWCNCKMQSFSNRNLKHRIIFLPIMYMYLYFFIKSDETVIFLCLLQ